VGLAIQLLDGKTPTTSGDRPNTVLLDPVLVDNTTDAGKAELQGWLVDKLDPTWPLGLQIEGYTTYAPEQAIACKDL
jgi:hypothetical protein